jgi:membrane protein
VLPGFGSLPLYTIATFFFQEIAKDSLASKASSLAYNFMLAIFPAIIFIFTLIPYIPIDHFQDQLLSLIQPAFPNSAYITLKSTLEDIIKNQNGGLLSFGFLAALFFSTNGVHHLMEAFNKSSLQIESRTWFKQRIVSLTLTLLIVFALIFGLSIITLGEVVISFLESELKFKAAFWAMLIRVVRWVILVIMYFVTIALLYRYGPANAKKWRFFSAGSWLATILAVVTFWGFGFYINNFGTYNKVYGSIGTLIVLMIWLYLNSFIILLGFELNASIDLSKRSIKIVKPKFNTFKSQEPEESFQKNRLKQS